MQTVAPCVKVQRILRRLHSQQLDVPLLTFRLLRAGAEVSGWNFGDRVVDEDAIGQNYGGLWHSPLSIGSAGKE